MKKVMATYHRQDSVWEGKKWGVVITDVRVRVMATAEGYSMVRIPGCMPFAVSDKDLTLDSRPASKTAK